MPFANEYSAWQAKGSEREHSRRAREDEGTGTVQSLKMRGSLLSFVCPHFKHAFLSFSYFTLGLVSAGMVNTDCRNISEHFQFRLPFGGLSLNLEHFRPAVVAA